MGTQQLSASENKVVPLSNGIGYFLIPLRKPRNFSMMPVRASGDIIYIKEAEPKRVF